MEREVVPNAGAFGVNKDLSVHELPLGVWTDSFNIRFLDGYINLILGEGEYFQNPPVVPYYIFPVTINTEEYWIYAGANKLYSVNITSGNAVHTNITRQVAAVDADYTAEPNTWTFTTLAGVPIVNSGTFTDPPQQWDLNLSNRATDLSNWPVNTWCKSLRGYKQFLIALNIKENSNIYPYRVKWSSAADPGAVPSTWDISDATKEAGQFDLPEGFGEIIDGLQLKDSFMIYRQDSIWRMDLVGGNRIFNFKKVIGNAGAMNRNCITEINGDHLVLTNSDIIIHDGWRPTSILNRVSRRHLFQNIDPTYRHLCFVFRNEFFNEAYICYPDVGSTVCNRALVWNYVDKTVSFREMPSVYHAYPGPIDARYDGTWQEDNDPWEIDETTWDGPEIVPADSKVMLAQQTQLISLLDTNYSDQGNVRSAFVERRSLIFGSSEIIKLIRYVRPKVRGHTGETINVMVGGHSDPFADPVWTTKPFIIGSDHAVEFLVSGRYIALRFESNSAFKWRIDSFSIEYEMVGDDDFVNND